jgi:cob(I)alamin adenosyltransferase
MAIYTRSGDEGFTERPGAQRVRKSDPWVGAVGAVDELNAHIGVCLQSAGAKEQAPVREALTPLQSELLVVGALLGAAGTDQDPGVSLEDSAVQRMEQQIDDICSKLPPLRHFVLPGGCELACRLHLARTVSQRAERAIVAAADTGCPVPPIILRYLNRLTDLLFALGRLGNSNAGEQESVWNPQDPS